MFRRLFLYSSFAFALKAGAGLVPPPEKRERQTRFEEISPLVTHVELKMGDPFIEVFISGMAELDCFDVHEFVVEKKNDRTLVIPRFRRSNPEMSCKGELKEFHDKAADLDPANVASRKVDVLGYRGWIHESISR